MLAALLALSGITASAASASSSRFSDVSDSHQFHTQISWLAEMRVATGYADGTFRPRDAVSREAFAAFLYRLVGSPQVTLPSRSPFTDVPTSAQFYKEIVWLSQQRITTGWADGTFRPKDRISREAVSAFLYRGSTGLHGTQDRYYEVGAQIFPGTYVSNVKNPNGQYPWCAWERHETGDRSWHYLTIAISNRGRSIATVDPSDGFFLSNNCVNWTPLRPTTPNATSFGEGMHVAGYHMQPGTYRVQANGGCRADHWDGHVDYGARVIPTIRGDGQEEVHLRVGHIVASSVECGTWTRVAN